MGTKPSEEGRAKRVLVADDDADVCALFCAALGALADVTTVGDAESALALLHEDCSYDALISDFMLPGIDGLEFVASVRRDRPSLPIMMISGHGRAVRERARAAGADAFLDKPFSLAQLRDTVGGLLRRTSTRVA